MLLLVVLVHKPSILDSLASMPVQTNDTAVHVEDRDGDLDRQVTASYRRVSQGTMSSPAR